MKKTYTIAGIGVCLGKTPGCEALAESIIAGTDIAKTQLADSLSLAVREALQYTSQKYLPALTDTTMEYSSLGNFVAGEPKVCGSLQEMLENQATWMYTENIKCFLLLVCHLHYLLFLKMLVMILLIYIKD